MSVSCDTCKNGNKDCPHICLAGSDYEPMTNADRIRNMTDEELAIIIMCPYDGTKNADCFMEGRNCIQCCMEWLQAEVEEGENDG